MIWARTNNQPQGKVQVAHLRASPPGYPCGLFEAEYGPSWHCSAQELLSWNARLAPWVDFLGVPIHLTTPPSVAVAH